MQKFGLLSLLSLCLLSAPAMAQEPGAVVGGIKSYGFSSSYSPDSSHMFIGLAEQRTTTTIGYQYTHLLQYGRHERIDYEGSVTPFYSETDPTLIGTTTTLNGQTMTSPQTPVRVITVDRAPVGEAHMATGVVSPIYAVYGSQTTYAASLSPIGARIGVMPRSRIQPSFAVNLGFVVSSRDIPVNESDRFNYMFAFGPGIQIFSTPQSSVRLEYIYRHISNAHQGYLNPGVDQAVFRVTFSHHRTN